MNPSSLKKPLSLWVFGLIALSSACLQCTPLTPYQTETGLGRDAQAEKFPITVSGKGPEFSLASIEFDDQGELWNPEQLGFVVDEIEREGRAKPLLLIVYTHGWNHNADPDADNNLRQFETVLAGLSRTFHKPESGEPARRVFGVYMGWRGRSVHKGRILSDFWDRMSAARRVGNGAAVTDGLFSVTSTAKRVNPLSKVIVIGHSFGGIVVENAISQNIAGHIGASAGDGARLPMPADLVMLVSQAERSTSSRQLVTTLKRRDVTYDRRGPDGKRVPMPMLVSITSENDLATRLAFPIGAGLGRLVQSGEFSGKLRPGEGINSYNDPASEGSQRFAMYHTPGHNPNLWSHRSTLVPYPSGTPAPLSPTELWSQNRHPLVDASNGSLGFRTTQGLLTIEPLGGFNTTPYWIFRVSQKLVKDHNGFWTKNVMAMAVSLSSMKEGLELSNGTSLGPDRHAKPRVLR